MRCQYLAVLLLTTTIAGLTTYMHDDTVCPVKHDQMPCKMTVMSLYVNIGENLIMNCTCFGKNNGQWIGPNRTFVNTTGDHFMPYSQGQELNPILNKSKFRVVGDYHNKICNLKILNFLSDDEGTYECNYIDSDAVNIHTYNVLTARPEYDSNTSTEKEITYTIHYLYPATRYFEHYEPSSQNIVSVKWMMPLMIILIISIVAAVALLKRRKGNSDLPTSHIEERRREDNHGQSIENSLYQSSDLQESRRHNSVTQHESLLPSNMQNPERRRANETPIETGCNTDHDIRRIPKGARTQFNEISMNYAEVMFDNRPPTHLIIRGIEDKTIYSEIDHLSKAEPLPSSSSESEDDTIFVPKVETFPPMF